MAGICRMQMQDSSPWRPPERSKRETSTRTTTAGPERSETAPGHSLDTRRGSVQHPKATAWGAGVMGAAGLLGAVLGPSPLVAPIVPLISLAWVPFAFAASVLGVPGGLGELGVMGKAAFVVWSAALGAAGGRFLAAWWARRRKRGAGRD